MLPPPNARIQRAYPMRPDAEQAQPRRRDGVVLAGLPDHRVSSWSWRGPHYSNASTSFQGLNFWPPPSGGTVLAGLGVALSVIAPRARCAGPLSRGSRARRAGCSVSTRGTGSLWRRSLLATACAESTVGEPPAVPPPPPPALQARCPRGRRRRCHSSPRRRPSPRRRARRRLQCQHRPPFQLHRRRPTLRPTTLRPRPQNGGP
jgi:hypothetical protein